MYKYILEAESKRNAVIDGSFKQINNQDFAISTKEKTKTFMTLTDIKDGS